MRIIKIEWRNFSSYGNKKQMVEFPEDPSLFQIYGTNGAGKSTISQAITFALYGKVEGKKLGDIPNRINGNAWVKIEFESGSRIITVERGLEPSLFNLSINGVLYDQAGQKNIQEYLTEDLLGIPYYVFNNTISLSINDFKSFLRMSPQDKRAIIDRIFGFQILNQMREIIKGESKRIKEQSDLLRAKIESTENSISRSVAEMESLMARLEETRQDQLLELEKGLADFLELQKLHSQKISDFKEEEAQMTGLVSASHKSLIELRSRIGEISRRLKLYDQEKCPTCESSLSGEFHQSIKSGLSEELDKAKRDLVDVENNHSDLLSSEHKISQRKRELLDKGTKIEIRIRELRKELSGLQNQEKENQVSSLQRIVENLRSDRDQISAESMQVSGKGIWLKTLDEILGEKGVKQMAIKTILPSLNSEIAGLLSQLSLDYQVIFDEEFKASIYHLGIEIPVQTLSTGEMKKVDFVVLIAILKLMKLKFSSVNLLFLDELFSSVDPDGVHSILAILKANCRELGVNIFVINHAPMPHEIFDWRIEVRKSNNFSSLLIDKF